MSLSSWHFELFSCFPVLTLSVASLHHCHLWKWVIQFPRWSNVSLRRFSILKFGKVWLNIWSNEVNFEFWRFHWLVHPRHLGVLWTLGWHSSVLKVWSWPWSRWPRNGYLIIPTSSNCALWSISTISSCPGMSNEFQMLKPCLREIFVT